MILLETVRDLVKKSIYPTKDLVLSTISVSNSTDSFLSNNFAYVSLIDWLNSIDSKIDTFLSIAVVSNRFLTLEDLELDLISFLNSFCVPSLHEIEKSLENVDPNEIDLDCDTCDTPSFVSIVRFEDYGLGPLHFHPRLRCLFPIPLQFPRVNKLDVYVCLTEFCALYSGDHLSLGNFVHFLCSKFAVSDPRCLGVFFVPNSDFTLEFQTVHSLAHQRRKILWELQKLEFESTINKYDNLAASCTSIEKALPPDEKHHLDSELSGKTLLKRIKINTCKPQVKEFVDIVTRKVQDNDYQHRRAKERLHTHEYSQRKKPKTERVEPQPIHDLSFFSASYSKVQQAIQALMENKISPENENESMMERIVLTLSDYVMLHIGGSKYRIKRLYLDSNDTIENSDLPISSLEQGQVDQTDQKVSLEQESLGEESLRKNCLNVIETGCHDLLSLNYPHSHSHSHSHKANLEIDKNGMKCEEIQDNKKLEERHAGNDDCQTMERSLETNLGWKRKMNTSVVVENRMKFDDGYRQKGPNRIGNISVIPNEIVRKYYDYDNQSNPNKLKKDCYYIGHLGEALVYRLLQHSFPTSVVEWTNQFQETNAPYDLTINSPIHSHHIHHRKKTFIEVKTTRHCDKNVFALSYWEWAFLSGLPKVNYTLYRVYGINDPNDVYIEVVHDVFDAVQKGEIKLCLAI